MIHRAIEHERICDETSISNINLELTEAYYEPWKILVDGNLTPIKLEEFEQMIRSFARMEWGIETQVDFDRDNKQIHVRHGQRARSFGI